MLLNAFTIRHPQNLHVAVLERLVPPALLTTASAVLPAHLLVLCGGSEHIAAAYKQWCDDGCGVHPRTLAAPAHLEFPVTLTNTSELPHVHTALRYIYTGKLPNRTATVAELLQVRRQAVRLRITGCVERCDEALNARATTTAGVLELHSCRHLLTPLPLLPPSLSSSSTVTPSSNDSTTAVDSSATALLSSCRKQLTHSCGAYLASMDANALGELLTWLFPDAPSVLSDRLQRRQLQSLPAAALEALLSCDSFATDNEASVLLMLSYWLVENAKTSMETLKRLCRRIRLRHLNSAYLYGLLPKIIWFPISRDEHQVLCQYTVGNEDQRRVLIAAATASGKLDCSCQWYAAPPRPQSRADSGKPYDWTINEEDLAADLDLAVHKIPNGLTGAFVNGAVRLVAEGFEWYPGALWFNNDGLPELVLCCAVPAPLAAFTTAKDVVGVVSIVAEAVVYCWCKIVSGSDDSCGKVRREIATRQTYGSEDGVSVTSVPAWVAAMGWRLTLFGKGFEKAPGAAAKLMPKLAQYLYDGKLRGSVTFLVK